MQTRLVAELRQNPWLGNYPVQIIMLRRVIGELRTTPLKLIAYRFRPAINDPLIHVIPITEFPNEGWKWSNSPGTSGV